MSSDRVDRVRQMYEAFASGDRDVIEAILTDDFRFSSPVDPDLDRAGYFERCWPGSGQRQRFDFVRIVEAGDEVIVTYEMTGRNGARGRNTEVLTFDGDRIRRAEVYFGWDLTSGT
jgi:ketosteroid isomerase-like protein